MSTEQRKHENFDFTKRVAAEMGESWTAKPFEMDAWAQVILGPNDEYLMLRPEYGNSASAKWTISAHYPDGWSRIYVDRDVAGSHEINVSRDRGARVMAREIKRRLLPGYLPALAYVKGRLAENNAYQVTTAITATRIAQCLGKPETFEPADRLNVPWRADSTLREGYGDFEAAGDGVRITLSVPVHIAELVALALAEVKAEVQA